MMEPAPAKRARESVTRLVLSDAMRLAREMWYPTTPYKQRPEAEEDRDFREWFGCGANVCILTYNLLIDSGYLPLGGELRHLLWSLLYWKSDGKKRTLAKMCGGISKDTLRKWARLFAEAVSALEGGYVVS